MVYLATFIDHDGRLPFFACRRYVSARRKKSCGGEHSNQFNELNSNQRAKSVNAIDRAAGSNVNGFGSQTAAQHSASLFDQTCSCFGSVVNRLRGPEAFSDSRRARPVRRFENSDSVR